MPAFSAAAAGEVDLHMHSTCSDGRLAPAELVAEACRAELSGLALTDHDTLNGLAAAAAASGRHGLLFVPGIELTCELEGKETHLLGYGLDPANRTLQEALFEETQARRRRARSILERLGRMGIQLELSALRADHGPIGRPHIASAMVEQGVCADTRIAFERYLGSRGAAFVPRWLRPLESAIDLLHQCGAYAVLAHPGAKLGPQQLVQLKRWGLDGIEVAHPRHNESTERSLRRLAAKFELIATSGSDFHGLPGQRLGRPCAPRELAERLAAGRPDRGRANQPRRDSSADLS